MDFESIASANSAIRAGSQRDDSGTSCAFTDVRGPIRGEWLLSGRSVADRFDATRTLAVVKRSMIERKLRENGDELKRAHEEHRVSTEQLEHLTDEADEARIRAMASETPLAEQEFYEASRHAEKMRRHHTELEERISLLETRQDQLLDEMMGS